MAGSTFDSKSKTIGELLSASTRERIIVPQFQRGYEWGKKHVEAFWKDILQFRKESTLAGGPEKYFLGPIVILQKSRTEIELLDGQQRVATATILLTVLRDIAKSTGIADGLAFARDTQSQHILKENGDYTLSLSETDEEYFRDAIQNENDLNPKPRIRTHRNIKEARALLMEKVKNEVSDSNPNATLAVLRELRQVLRSDLVMASIPVESERDAFRIFETLNDRGLRLSVPDLLLNYLMREAKPGHDRKAIRALWTEMVERMGRRDINRFLRHMWVSKYGDLKSKDLFSALKEYIESKNIKPLELARACADECETYVQIVNIDEQVLKNAAPHVRRLLRDLDAQASLPLLLSAFRKIPAAEFLSLTQWLLVFVTRYSVIANLDSSGMETVFFEMAREIRNFMESADSDEKQQVKKCMAYIKGFLIKEAPTDPQITLAVQSFSLSPEAAGYFMGKLATHMQTNTREIAVNDANVEHVFPRNPEENEWGGASNQESLEPLTWNIGNLTILGRRLNNKVQNKEYSVKRAYYADNSELVMAQNIATHYDKWDESTIKARAARLAPLVLEVWNFENASRV